MTYSGPQSEFVGLDQINIGPLPASLVGAGEVEVVIIVDGVQRGSSDSPWKVAALA